MKVSTEPAYRRWAGLLLLLAPAVAAVVFVQLFASSLPLTDEWNYVHAIREIDSLRFDSLAHIGEAFRHYPLKHNEHFVVTPFPIYWPLAEWSHFDSRYAIGLTLLIFGAQAWIMRQRLLQSPWALIPVAIVVFSSAHYMEFLWGWQITLGFSVLFPLWGLAIIDRIPAESSWPRYLRSISGGLACITLGLFSSAGGFFGFPAALVLVALKPGNWRIRVGSGLLIALVGFGLYRGFMAVGPSDPSFGVREFWYVLTALGATLWGSPVGLFEFEFDARSAGGLVLLLCLGAVLVRAIVSKRLPHLAFGLSVTCFGFLCVIPIAMSRPYLGNWHLQYALPAIYGTYAMAYTLWHGDRTRWSTIPFAALVLLLTSGLFGTYQGFRTYGPSYRDYTASIESYMIQKLDTPDINRPYPEQDSNRELDLRLTLFLSAHDHPVFRALPPPTELRPLTEEAKLFLGDKYIPTFETLPTDLATTVHLTLSLPTADASRGILLRTKSFELTLRRVDMSHAPSAIHEADRTYYMAALIPHLLPNDGSSVEWLRFD